MKWGISRSSVFLMAAFLLGVAGMSWRILSVEVELPQPLAADPHVTDEEDFTPKLTVENMSLVHSRGGTKERILKCRRAWKRGGRRGDIYEFEEPRVLLARVRDVSFTLEADRGWFYPRSGDVRLAGNVHAASGTDREFFADTVRYFAETDRLVAKGEERPLRLVDQGSEIEGRVLKTDGRFESIEITDVEGKMGVDMVQPGLLREATDENQIR